VRADTEQVKYCARKATATDASAIGEAHAEAWRVAYRPLFTHHFLARAVEVRRVRWQHLLTAGHLDGVLLVIEHEEVGVVGFHHAGPSETSGFDAEVYGFYLHPGHWGSGAADVLMSDGLACQRETGAATCHLWTHEGGERARAFYERTGWRVTGRTRSHDFGDIQPAPLIEYETTL
jgi:GNAT superfamily N-acetyltransferase